MKVRVYHEMYGCDTGCCGHVVALEDGKRRHFEFGGPCGEDRATWARDYARSVIATKWPDCLGSIDWDSIDIEHVAETC